MHETLQGDQVDFRPDKETPFRDGIGALRVTQDEANGIRALIRELAPGVYLKCAKCDKLKVVRTGITNFVGKSYHCDECA